MLIGSGTLGRVGATSPCGASVSCRPDVSLRLKLSVVMATLASLLVICLVSAIWAANPNPCRMRTWQIHYTDTRTLHPMGMPCYEYCRSAVGEVCTFTHSWQNGNLFTCDAYITEEAPPHTLTLAVKICHTFMHTCDTFTCNPCFPCHDNAYQEPFSECGVLPVRLRYSERESLGQTDAVTCTERCMDDADCLWVTFRDDVCQFHRYVRKAASTHDVNVTLRDFRCS